MNPSIASDLIDYIGILSRLQSLQLLGFILACTSMVILLGGIGLGRMKLGDRILLYLTASLIFTSFVLGLFPDLKSLRLTYSLKGDLRGGLAVPQGLFFVYLQQNILALGSICSATLFRIRIGLRREGCHNKQN